MRTIPHSDQRYDTCGDWTFDIVDKAIVIKVSKLGDWRYEFLVGFHELVEVILCAQRGITGHEVDEFDIKFEQNRKLGDNSEPGDDPFAPYHWEHFFATTLERLLATEMDVNWDEYEAAINKLGSE